MKHTMRYPGGRVLFVVLTLCMVLSLTLTGVRADDSAGYLTDGSFETDIRGNDSVWKVEAKDWEAGLRIENTEEAAKEGSKSVNYWSKNAQTITVSQEVDLTAGTYTLTAYDQGADSTLQLFAGDQKGDVISLTGYGTWDLAELVFTVDAEGTYSVGAYLDCKASGWGTLDCMYLYRTGDIEKEHEHSYGTPVFRWAEDYSACSAVFTCVDGDDEQTENCDVSSEIAVAPTETEEGQLVYTAAVTFNGQSYTDTKTAAIPATGSGHEHSYGAPVFNWSKDYSTCEAVFTCEAGDDEQTVGCDVSKSTVEATEEKDGKTVYTATVTFDGQTYTGTAVVITPAITGGHEHSYGDPVFSWSKNYSICKATFTCEAGDDEQTVQCDVTSKTTVAATKTKNGKIVYTATVSFNGKTYTDTKTVTVAATGDSQSDSADGSKSSANTVRTGDTSRPLLWGTLGVLALAVILILFAVRRRSAGKR